MSHDDGLLRFFAGDTGVVLSWTIFRSDGKPFDLTNFTASLICPKVSSEPLPCEIDLGEVRYTIESADLFTTPGTVYGQLRLQQAEPLAVTLHTEIFPIEVLQPLRLPVAPQEE